MKSLPESAWNTPAFKAGNRAATMLWGAVFAAMVPCHIIAGSIDTTRGNLIFNWVLPGLLVMWAIKSTTVEQTSADPDPRLIDDGRAHPPRRLRRRALRPRSAGGCSPR